MNRRPDGRRGRRKPDPAEETASWLLEVEQAGQSPDDEDDWSGTLRATRREATGQFPAVPAHGGPPPPADPPQAPQAPQAPLPPLRRAPGAGQSAEDSGSWRPSGTQAEPAGSDTGGWGAAPAPREPEPWDTQAGTESWNGRWPFEETNQSWEPDDRSYAWPAQELPSHTGSWDAADSTAGHQQDPWDSPQAFEPGSQTGGYPAPSPYESAPDYESPRGYEPSAGYEERQQTGGGYAPSRPYVDQGGYQAPEGYPPTGGYGQPDEPPAAAGYPSSPGYAPESGYAPGQGSDYPPTEPGYGQLETGHAQPEPGYAPGTGYPPASAGYAPAGSGYAQSDPGYAPGEGYGATEGYASDSSHPPQETYPQTTGRFGPESGYRADAGYPPAPPYEAPADAYPPAGPYSNGANDPYATGDPFAPRESRDPYATAGDPFPIRDPYAGYEPGPTTGPITGPGAGVAGLGGQPPRPEIWPAQTGSWQVDEPVRPPPGAGSGELPRLARDDDEQVVRLDHSIGDAGSRSAGWSDPSARAGRGEARLVDDGEHLSARSRWPRVVALVSWLILLMVLCWFYVFPFLERILPENF